ncbi:uncharacterized protein LOC131327665 [Rhododendron vialii]|uniref:uncharacterized protein LOC131327665 n=1 Tax=Rhododendron vialii TaxID=182163 RepID=UPI002660185C|nr:uncharacterized protein LOC131327665 [Rhododendron vialii]
MAGHARLSFLDAYRGYHQIAMDPEDMEKTAFITPYGIFCYRVMPFGLKNSGATFKRAIFKMLYEQIGHTMEAYIDDLVGKSQKEFNHPQEFAEVFKILKLLSTHAISSTLVRREGVDDMPIYFTRKMLLPAQTRYLPFEKLALALVLIARKLLSYFQSHTITVLTEHPLKSLFRKADLCNRVSKWAVELANFDICFEPQTAIKGQILADFITKLTPDDTDSLNTRSPPQPITKHKISPKPWHLFQGDIWHLHVVEVSNSNKAGVILVSPCGTLHESFISIDFPATNNEAEYEAFLAGLRSAIAMKVDDLAIFCDSQLIVNQVLGDYEARDPRMLKYQATATELIQHFKHFKIEQINHEHNTHADALAGLASASQALEFRTTNFGRIDHPTCETTPEVLNIELSPNWMDEIVAFLRDDTLPTDKKEAYRIRNKVAYYWLFESSKLYKKSISGPYLLVIHPTYVPDILAKLHSYSCGCHSGGRSLCQRAMSQGYFWKNMKKDFENGLDIVGKLPTAPGGFKFLITTTDYFSKWVEAEPLVTNTEADVRRLVWRNIVTKFDVPYVIVCEEFGIRFFNSTSTYPQGISQAEATNKTVCVGIKHRLNSKRGKWAEELPRVLWADRSTPKRSTDQTPFSMAFGMEAVIPLESRFPTLRTKNFDPKANEEAVDQELILVEEKRDDARLKLAEYQQQVAKGYNRSVRTKTFNPDYLVWRKVVQANKKTKFKPNWEGPFHVVRITSEGA